MKKKYLLYARVVCQAQEADEKLENQVTTLKGFAKERRLKIDKIYKEIGLGKIAIQNIIDKADKGSIVRIICTDLGRLTRDKTLFLQLYFLAKKGRIEILTLDGMVLSAEFLKNVNIMFKEVKR